MSKGRLLERLTREREREEEEEERDREIFDPSSLKYYARIVRLPEQQPSG